MTYMGSWTTQEINCLKDLFKNRSSLKSMSQHLGRSPSAINKALSRFGIRKPLTLSPPLKLASKITFSASKTPPSSPSASSTFIKSPLSPKKPASNEKAQKRTYLTACTSTLNAAPISWVSLGDVVEWLNSHYIRVSKTASTQNPSATTYTSHYIGKEPVSPLQLVMYANHLRLQKKQAVFMVRGVTW
ncbi:MAG TPA: hypothetical protein VI959_03125 [Alphaproteobacteria bacterium]|nr:hypothetical protein [Alphaproteobacteria bacterium]